MKAMLRFSKLAVILFSLSSLSYAAAPSLDASLQSTMDKYRTKFHIPGVALSVVLPGNAGIKDYFSGTTSVMGKDPVTQDSLFQIGGISKSFTAAIVLQLVAEGKLSLDDTLDKWLKQYPDWKSITLRQLLNETSGVFDYLAIPNVMTDLMTSSETGPSNWPLDGLTDLAYKHKPNRSSKPGKKWAPSNTNYILLGMVIQAATGHAFQDEINQRLLGAKLGLSNTYYLPYPQTALDHLVHGFETDGSTDISHFNMSWEGPAAGLISNSHDIVQWSQALFNGRVLQPAQLTQMTTLVSMKNGQPLKAGDYSNGVGFGIEAGVDAYTRKYGVAYGYDGNTLGYRAQFVYLPCYDLTVAVTVNTMALNSKDLSGMMADVLKTVTAANKPLKGEQLPAVCKKLK